MLVRPAWAATVLALTLAAAAPASATPVLQAATTPHSRSRRWRGVRRSGSRAATVAGAAA